MRDAGQAGTTDPHLLHFLSHRCPLPQPSWGLTDRKGPSYHPVLIIFKFVITSVILSKTCTRVEKVLKIRVNEAVGRTGESS